MMSRNSAPLVGIICCSFMRSYYPFHGAGDKYVRAVSDGFGGIPLLIPALGNAIPTEDLIERLDGLLCTGSPSNVEPALYDGEPSLPGTLHDTGRDATSMPLLRAAVERGVPVLAICRGLQEMNVAFGGSLHQRVQEVPGHMDHRSNDDVDPIEVVYALKHPVKLAEGGLLARITGQKEMQVNSLHTQGINRLAPPLQVEATAPDGLIEAFSVKNAKTFTLATQWHPEWKFRENPNSNAIIKAFGEAAIARAAARNGVMAQAAE